MCHGSHNVIKSNYMHNLGIGPYNFKMLDIRNSELKFEDPLEGSVSLSYLTIMIQAKFSDNISARFLAILSYRFLHTNCSVSKICVYVALPMC